MRRSPTLRFTSILLLSLSLSACSGGESAIPAEGEVVTPPFEVQGEAEGLMLVWFDAEGPHTAQNRSAIPEAHRELVRVDDLTLPLEARLDPAYVYVADLSSAGESGHPVRRMAREAFDTHVDEASRAAASPEPAAPTADADADVIIYGASWCGACRSTAAYLRERGVAFVERDIEREPGAREEMQSAARAAGVSPTGIPVIDFRGEIITGFNRGALARAIERSGAAI